MSFSYPIPLREKKTHLGVQNHISFKGITSSRLRATWPIVVVLICWFWISSRLPLLVRTPGRARTRNRSSLATSARRSSARPECSRSIRYCTPELYRARLRDSFARCCKYYSNTSLQLWVWVNFWNDAEPLPSLFFSQNSLLYYPLNWTESLLGNRLFHGCSVQLDKTYSSHLDFWFSPPRLGIDDQDMVVRPLFQAFLYC